MALGGLTLVSFYKSIQIHLRKKELEKGEIKERLVESKEIGERLERERLLTDNKSRHTKGRLQSW
jgi:hypothetical protein